MNKIATLVEKEPNDNGVSTSSDKNDNNDDKHGIIDLKPVGPVPDYAQAQFMDWTTRVVVDEVSQMLGSQQNHIHEEDDEYENVDT